MKQRINYAVGTMLLITAGLLFGAPCQSMADNRRDSGSDKLQDSQVLLNVLGDVYWRNAFGVITIPPDRNGNPVVAGIALLPLPDNSSGPIASIDVTLQSGQAFFLPLDTILGTSYSDGTPPDQLLSFKVLKKNTVEFSVRIDGRKVLDEHNMLDSTSQSISDPPIPYIDPPLAGIIFEQGLCLFHGPLRPGRHVIQLDVKITAVPPILPITSEFHNTFNVTVQPD